MTTITVKSSEYGAETFEYDSTEEAVQGLVRLMFAANAENDGVERTYTIEEIQGA